MAVRVAGRHCREQQKKYAVDLSQFLSVVTGNPFTAPACNISGLKDARGRLQTVYFPVLYKTSTFNAVRLDGDPFTCQ